MDLSATTNRSGSAQRERAAGGGTRPTWPLWKKSLSLVKECLWQLRLPPMQTRQPH